MAAEQTIVGEWIYLKYLVSIMLVNRKTLRNNRCFIRSTAAAASLQSSKLKIIHSEKSCLTNT